MIPGFYVWETATFDLKLSSPILVDYNKIIVSIYQPSRTQLDLTLGDGSLAVKDASTIGVSLTQEQTSMFRPGLATLQLNVLFNSTERDVSSEATLHVYSNLYERVME